MPEDKTRFTRGDQSTRFGAANNSTRPGPGDDSISFGPAADGISFGPKKKSLPWGGMAALAAAAAATAGAWWLYEHGAKGHNEARPEMQFMIGALVTTEPTTVTVDGQQIQIPANAAVWSMKGPMGRKISPNSTIYVCMGKELVGTMPARGLHMAGNDDNPMPAGADMANYHEKDPVTGEEECSRAVAPLAPGNAPFKGGVQRPDFNHYPGQAGTVYSKPSGNEYH